MKLIEKSWGNEVWWADTELYLAKFLTIRPNMATSLHVHGEKDEIMYVQEGNAVILGEDDKPLHESPLLVGADTIRILPGTPHRICAGEYGVTIIEVSTPHPEDSVRIRE